MVKRLSVSLIIAVLLFNVFQAAAFAQDNSLKAINLRCEYQTNPLGIDVVKPRLSWVIESSKQGQIQTAYQILVASAPALLKQGKADLWDSGRVASDRSIQMEYAGKPLTSRTKCYWQVRVWDKNGNASVWSKPAIWTMGLLSPKDWQAKWIGLYDVKAKNEDPLTSSQWIWFPEGEPAAEAPSETRCFRGNLILPADRKIVKATAVISADDNFGLYLNGKKAGHGDGCAVVKLDVTASLQNGLNIVAISATNTGGPAGLIAAIKIEFALGQPLTFCTDAQWKTNQAKVDGWELTDFDDSKWVNVKPLGAYGTLSWGSIAAVEKGPLPARYLRRDFTVQKKVASATAYVCGLGVFDFYLNGQPVSDQIMSPAISDYKKAAYYVTFDITDRLRSGKNTLGVVLGNGRFFAPRVRGTMDYGVPVLLMQTEIQYADGTKQTVISDESWKITADGPIRANNEYDGEEYDARMEMPGWDKAGFDDSKWQNAQIIAAPKGILQAQMIEPMRITQILKPIGITNPKPGVFIVDMGQCIYGSVRLKASGPRNAKVVMTCAYNLLPDGMLKTADNRTAKATDIYTFKGQGKEIWNPRLKGQGFRYAQITGFPGTPTVDNFDGLLIHTDFKPVGEFSCSNELINKIHTAMRWGFRNYWRSAPLEPDRDERMAWLGDPAKDAESEAYNFDMASAYTKFQDDIRRSQKQDGSIPDKTYYWEGDSQIEWPSVYTIISDWFVDFYADKRLTENHYDAMNKWMLAMQKLHLQADGTFSGGWCSDWCDTASMDGGSESGATPRDLIATAYHYNNCNIMARAAQQLNKSEDQKRFTEFAEQIKAAFNKKYFDPATGKYGNGTQSSYVMPLAFGMVPTENRQAVIDNLVNDIMITNKGHLSVGLLGMQWLMQTLNDIGRPDVAWTIATQTDRPSWGYMIANGATTIWERWDTNTRDPGMNSESLLILAGNLDAWFYQTLAGINYDRQNPGFKHIIIKPIVLGDLKWVNAYYDSMYGRIISNWKLDGDKFVMNVTIPANTTATVYVPGGNAKPIEIGSGNYTFNSIIKK